MRKALKIAAWVAYALIAAWVWAAEAPQWVQWVAASPIFYLVFLRPLFEWEQRVNAERADIVERLRRIERILQDQARN